MAHTEPTEKDLAPLRATDQTLAEISRDAERWRRFIKLAVMTPDEDGENAYLFVRLDIHVEDKIPGLTDDESAKVMGGSLSDADATVRAFDAMGA